MSESISQKLPKEERRRKLLILIKKMGWRSINKTKLAEEWGISRKMLFVDYKILLKAFKEDDIGQISFDLGAGYENVLEVHKGIMNDPDSTKDEKARSASIVLSAQKEFTAFLEAYGKKTKVAERLALSQDPVEQLILALKTEGAKK